MDSNCSHWEGFQKMFGEDLKLVNSEILKFKLGISARLQSCIISDLSKKTKSLKTGELCIINVRKKTDIPYSRL